MFLGNRLTKSGVYLGMFEQFVGCDRFNKSKWTVLASLTCQCLAVSAAMLIPLIYTQGLPAVRWARISLPPAPHPPASERPAKPENAPSRRRIQNVFTAPAAIPRNIPVIVDQSDALISSSEIDTADALETNSGLVSLLPELLKEAPVVAAPPEPARKQSSLPSAPLRVSAGVQAAKLLRRVVPTYPELARRVRISGAVRLVAVIGKDGTIENLQVISGHPLLVTAAVEAVRQWLYRPTLLNGDPVEVIAPIEVNFTLNEL